MGEGQEGSVSTTGGPTTRPNAGLWPRYWARWLDLSIAAIPIGVVLELVANASKNWGTAGYVLGIVALWMSLEAILLAAFGTTPGKWICGIRVQRLGGGRPDSGEAARRCFGVWWRGVGFGVPLIAIGEAIVAYREFGRVGSVAWDRNAGTRVVQERPMTTTRAVFVTLLVIASIVLNVAARTA
jgi:uncharacterized RDD family membrane protein YckC